MTSIEIRKKFLKFFEERGHKIVPSSSLLPTDPSVLFTTAGMQQFKPYYTGEADPMKDFGSLNTVSIQKCIRTSDIDEVGDESHLTFFEMLGNFSFGGPSTGLRASYWKKEAIEYAYEFITKEMGLEIDYVTIFKGAGDIPADTESENIWKSVDSNIKIISRGTEDNLWGPTGDEGPFGPTTEIYVEGIEVWNLVFNQYYKNKLPESKQGERTLSPGLGLRDLDTKGVDTGMGLERLAMVVQKKNNIFETDLLQPIIDSTPSDMNYRVRRILTDHCRSISFLISDHVEPSNKDRGYVLRKLIRRVMTYSYLYLTRTSMSTMYNYENTLETASKIYGGIYPNLNFHEVQQCMRNEYVKFNKALAQGVNELKKFFNKFIQGIDPNNPGSIKITNNTFSGTGWGLELFRIYESFGLHPEISKDILIQWGLAPDQSVVDEYRKALKEAELKHKEISRAGAEKKFGGHGLILDTGELKAGNEEELKKATRLHTATHLLHAALRKILGNEVQQAGSDITAERLRFDFTFPRKLTSEEIKKVEDLVNEVIQKDYKVTKEEMPYEDAIKSGALAFFKLKYPNRVNVYTIGPELARGELVEPVEGQFFSKELCGGPHVTNTGMIGRFKITKEESISVGTRRIRAIVE